ncbi:4-amino-4-deoxy-L-arabinose-phosphoundecaprenol flippase subunit ArnE [Acerihabitans sp. TG2]|uniref:4-amino-4-deoxy-L-arabinose-phosphoundecaprenol flippase subunit ArnE n=1 Tax=Acerihabitans sp. TG2 TaxID=3096008 RepID=UPI002B2228FF|nr:4-amino-4-deoxy-L-arabinose-phosphoundecaprenol flippase subunit ArnE [Acerihabitans sp. TG2]MEA9390517.1 4-amino-4-deoxy-L-arabinose-phosphoundecaprenol flippase subunit ArnE [Acerihabitans sp. TG2]
MTGFLMILLVSVLTCAGQLCQKQAATRWAAVQPLAVRRFATLRWLVSAVVVMAIGLVVWLNVLQRLPLSLAYPMLSLNFVLVTLASHWFFGERITLRHWCGVFSIMLGILLMSIRP